MSFSMTRLATLVLAFATVAACAGSATSGSLPDPAQTGPYAVGFKYFQVTDMTRDATSGGRPVAVYVFYPVDPSSISAVTPKAVYPLDPYFGVMGSTTSDQWEKYGIGAAYQEPPVASAKPFPLVMFSPGWTLPAFMNLYVPIRVASHGFIVAVLTHYGDGVWPWEPWDHIAIACVNRPLDVSFVLSDLLVRNQTVGDPLEHSINPAQVVASGHSIGGYATMELASGIDSVCNNVEPNLWPEGPYPQFWPPVPPQTCVSLAPDTRIRAIVPIDGSNQMLLFQELARIKVPSTGIGEEWSILGGDGWQARQHAAMQGTPNYRVDVNNAFHTTFTNACEAGYVLRDIGFFSDADLQGWQEGYCNAPLPSAEVENLATKYMVAFLKTQLLGVQGYQSMLTPGYALASEQNIEFFVTEKRNPNAIEVSNPPLFIYFPHQPGSAQARAEKNPTHPRIIRPVRIVN